MNKTKVKSLFSCIENMNTDSQYHGESALINFYCFQSRPQRISETGQKGKRLHIVLCVNKNNEPRVLKIIPKNRISINDARKVNIASEAYYNFIANDFEGVQKLVDYLESDSHVFLVFESIGKTWSLQKFINQRYGSEFTVSGKTYDYGQVVLNVFKTTAISLLEMFNHGIMYNNFNSKNILINVETLQPSLTNFSQAYKVRGPEDLRKTMKSLGLMLYEMWIGSLDEVNSCDELNHELNHEDARVPEVIKSFISRTLFLSSEDQELPDEALNEIYFLLQELP